MALRLHHTLFFFLISFLICPSCCQLSMTLVYSEINLCVDAASSIHWPGNATQLAPACEANSLQFICSGPTSFSDLGDPISVVVVQFNSISFVYENAISCSSSLQTSTESCVKFQNTCDINFEWIAQDSCTYCSGAALSVLNLTSLQSIILPSFC